MNHRHLASIVCTVLFGSFGCASAGGHGSPMYTQTTSTYAAPAAAPTAYGRVVSSDGAQTNESISTGYAPPVRPSAVAEAPAPTSTSAAGHADNAGGPATRVSASANLDLTVHATTDDAPPPPNHEPPAAMRQGLATEWGETRQSTVGYTSFTRNSTQPFDTAAIYYNDASGVSAQASFRATQPVTFAGAYHDGVRVSLRDETGAPLSGYFVNGRLYVLGEGGQRYSIMIENNTSARFEAVVSVDGLDVINGRPAATGFRGYIIPAYGHISIDGFRQDSGHVAAFRFGAVGDSYAAQTGSARNVGVIGVALFSEYGVAMPTWNDPEVQLRETANPFPGQYAAPPPRRYYQ